jgi:hypothetical protein
VSKRKAKLNGKVQSTKSKKKWRKEVFGKSLMRKISQLIVGILRINGYSK